MEAFNIDELSEAVSNNSHVFFERASSSDWRSSSRELASESVSSECSVRRDKEQSIECQMRLRDQQLCQNMDLLLQIKMDDSQLFT